jgi:hypothetical protein
MIQKKNKLQCIRFIIFVIGLITSVHTIPAFSQSLKEIYATGSIRFIEEMKIDESHLPEGVFFESVTDMAADERGNIYFCDIQACNIKKFSPEGKFLKILGGKGQGPGEFNSPSRMVVSGNRLFIYDIGNRRICSLTTEGEQIKCINIQYTEGLPRKMKAHPQGDLLIEREVNYYHEKDKPQDILIQVFSPELELKKTLFKYSVLRNIFRTINGMFSNIIQPFSPYVYWSILPDGKVIIGLSEDYTVQIHHLEEGKLSSFTHPYKPVKVTHEDKEKFFSNLVYSTSQGRIEPPEEIKKLTKFPKTKPAFDALLVDYEGNILVHPTQKDSESFPPRFDAFTYQGQFIGTVSIIEGIQDFPLRVFVDKHSLWTLVSDKQGKLKVVKYKIASSTERVS